jgi:dolichyl-phosphate beta-glucosyltransferase
VPLSSVSTRPYLSVVVPAYNEEERLAASLPSIDAYLTARGIEAEILVVDDGSTDATGRVAGTLLRGRRTRVLTSRENRGKGHAVRRGVLAAEGRWVLLTDADLSTPIEEHAKLAAVARDHDLDVVIGSRALGESRVEIRQNRLRELLGKSYNRAVRWSTGLPFHDTQCGFKLFDLGRTKPLFELMVVDGFAYDVELLFLCQRFGLRVREVPVIWRNDPRTSVRMTHGMRAVLDLLRIRWRFRRGGYRLQDPAHAPPGSMDQDRPPA